MKRHVGDFVRRCLACQQVKAEHQKPAGLLQPLEIVEWKWELQGLIATARSLFDGHRPTLVLLLCHLLELCCSLVPQFVGVVLLPSLAI